MKKIYIALLFLLSACSNQNVELINNKGVLQTDKFFENVSVEVVNNETGILYVYDNEIPSVGKIMTKALLIDDKYEDIAFVKAYEFRVAKYIYEECYMYFKNELKDNRFKVTVDVDLELITNEVIDYSIPLTDELLYKVFSENNARISFFLLTENDGSVSPFGLSLVLSNVYKKYSSNNDNMNVTLHYSFVDDISEYDENQINNVQLDFDEIIGYERD